MYISKSLLKKTCPLKDMAYFSLSILKVGDYDCSFFLNIFRNGLSHLGDFMQMILMFEFFSS